MVMSIVHCLKKSGVERRARALNVLRGLEAEEPVDRLAKAMRVVKNNPVLNINLSNFCY